MGSLLDDEDKILEDTENSDIYLFHCFAENKWLQSLSRSDVIAYGLPKIKRSDTVFFQIRPGGFWLGDKKKGWIRFDYDKFDLFLKIFQEKHDKRNI